MSYAWFLGLFLVLPILLLSLVLRTHVLRKRYWLTTGLLLLPVMLCMAPWDHTAVSMDIWSWSPRQIWGPELWLVPLEEYLFAFFETILATMLVYSIILWQQGGMRKRSARSL